MSRQYSNTSSRPSNLILADYTTIDLLLINLLSLCTPHGQEHHISRIINSQPYIGTKEVPSFLDKKKGNVIITVGEAPYETMFSSHMDIVGNNSKAALEAGKVESIFLMTPNTETLVNSGMIYGAKRVTDKDGNKEFVPSTLGADDKIGVYIMLKLIEHKVPGLYIFHTGEECGAVGSRYMAEHHKLLFKSIKRAIAFDRAGYSDVICYQRGGRCASTEFGEALAKQLNQYMPPKQLFKGDQRGTFTDTASYMDFIPECTNISAGYFNQHGSEEHFDPIWLKYHLLPAILKIKWEELPTKRDPSKKDYGYTTTYNSNYSQAKKKSWDEVDMNTPMWEFPEWKPSMGHLPEQEERLVKKAIGFYVTRAFGKEKDDLVDTLFGLYEINEMLTEELIVKDTEIQALKRSSLKTDKKPTKDKTIADTQIVTKKAFLTALLDISDNIKIDGEYERWLNGYVKGAIKWLAVNKDRNVSSKFTKKELTKLNRLVYAMSCIVDIFVADTKDQALLDSIEEYISKHPEEEGWEIPKQQIVLNEQHLATIH